MSWKKSRDMCRQLSSDLANFETPEEINVVAKGMREQGLSKIFFIETAVLIFVIFILQGATGSGWGRRTHTETSAGQMGKR